jgi:trk system potassium uptake protein
MTKLLFETLSAFGTVWLSTGITGNLSPVGRVLITLMMFIGRLGPLTMAFALLSNRKEAKVKYAEEKILIG